VFQRFRRVRGRVVFVNRPAASLADEGEERQQRPPVPASVFPSISRKVPALLGRSQSRSPRDERRRSSYGGDNGGTFVAYLQSVDVLVKRNVFARSSTGSTGERVSATEARISSSSDVFIATLAAIFLGSVAVALHFYMLLWNKKKKKSAPSKNKNDNDSGDDDGHNNNNNNNKARGDHTGTKTKMKNKRSTSGGSSAGRRPPLPESDAVQQQQQLLQMVPRTSTLHRKTPSLSSYQTTPISKHYELNQQILSAFESHYSNKVYRIAYAMGLQFVETALLEIPKHGYFYSKRHERERMESSLEAVRVTQLLKELQEDADASVHVTPVERQRLDRLEELAVSQVQKASDQQYEGQRAAAEAELRSSDHSRDQSDFGLCEPILVAYDSFSNLLCPTSTAATVPPQQQPPSPVAAEVDRTPAAAAAADVPGAAIPMSRRVTTAPPSYNEVVTSQRTQRPSVTSSVSSTASSNLWLPPTQLVRAEQSQSSSSIDPAFLLATAASRSTATLYDHNSSLNSMAEDIMLEKALYLSGLEVTPTVSLDYGESSSAAATAGEFKYSDDDERIPPPLLLQSDKRQQYPHASDGQLLADSAVSVVPSPLPQPKPAVSGSMGLEFAMLSKFSHEDFDELRRSGLIRVSFIDTYQGRMPESTNGCTVIAPLLCIHHLLEDPDLIPDPGLPDGVIEQVIDVETPSILTELRTKLGLSAQAFLIPSDAHDYLIDNGQLSQQHFINVIGGNILNEAHLQKFVTALEDSDYCKTSGRLRKVAATFFFHEHVVAILKVRRDYGDSCWYDLVDGLPLKQTLAKIGENDASFNARIGLTESQELMSDAFLPKTARIRCLNAQQALTACLRWYACSKFTADNVTYIDQYPWDDNSCDFDPRVFQGFVWGSLTE